MTRIYRWNPFREMLEMQKSLDRMFGEVNRVYGDSEWSAAGNWLALDVVENEDGYIVTADLPGLISDDVGITLHENTLTISGEIAQPEIEEGNRWLLQERHYGQFRRSITLHEAVDADQVNATFENGVLTLTMPKSEASKPRQIPIKSQKILASQN